jgi:hypothetical protein
MGNNCSCASKRENGKMINKDPVKTIQTNSVNKNKTILDSVKHTEYEYIFL